jgi:hypothetical protein
MEPVALEIIRKVKERILEDELIPYRERLAAVRVVHILFEELSNALTPSPTPSTNPREVPDHRDPNPTDSV